MGEARRRKKLIMSNRCGCGSGFNAGSCCFKRGFWHRESANVQLFTFSEEHSNPGCYLAPLGNCFETLSREHMISASVLRVISGETIQVSGFPWLGQGESRKIGINSLVARCLCSSHNSALSNLDTEAARFFVAVRDALGTRTGQQDSVHSGHDIERWLLKMLVGMCRSGNLSSQGVRLPAGLPAAADIVTRLYDATSWPVGTGLFLTMKKDDQFKMAEECSFASLTRDDDGALAGVLCDLFGLRFALIVAQLDMAKLTAVLGTSLYRPGKISISGAAHAHQIRMSWDDGLEHGAVTIAT